MISTFPFREPIRATTTGERKLDGANRHETVGSVADVPETKFGSEGESRDRAALLPVVSYGEPSVHAHRSALRGETIPSLEVSRVAPSRKTSPLSTGCQSPPCTERLDLSKSTFSLVLMPMDFEKKCGQTLVFTKEREDVSHSLCPAGTGCLVLDLSLSSSSWSWFARFWVCSAKARAAC